MSYINFISKRFFYSKNQKGFISFITIISVIGVVIGVASLIIAVSVLNGFENEIQERTISLSSHIQVSSFKPVGITNHHEAIEKLRLIDNISSVKPFVQKEAVIKFKDIAEGIIVKGVRNEDNIFSEQRTILKGSPLLSKIDSNTYGLIIGNKLADKLKCDLNSKVFLLATVGIPSPTNTPTIKQFRVSGIYESGLREYDDVLVYTEMSVAQDLFKYGQNVTGLEVMVKDIETIEDQTNDIKKILGYPLTARSIFKIYKGLFTWVELQKEPIPIILGLIIIVAAFNIIGTLLMIVLEKTKDIGILKTLGSTDKEIVKIFVSQGMIIAFVGILLGNIIGYGLCILQLKYDMISLPEIYFMNKVPMELSILTGIIISLIAFVVCFLAVLIPSYLASRLKPVTSLKFN